MDTTSLCVHAKIKKLCCSHKKLKRSIRAWSRTRKRFKVIAFYQEAWLKPYIEMNTELRKNAKNDFEKEFYKLMNNAMFGKTMDIVRKHRDIKLVTDKIKRCKLASKPNYDTTKSYSKEFVAMEIK